MTYGPNSILGYLLVMFPHHDSTINPAIVGTKTSSAM